MQYCCTLTGLSHNSNQWFDPLTFRCLHLTKEDKVDKQAVIVSSTMYYKPPCLKIMISQNGHSSIKYPNCVALWLVGRWVVNPLCYEMPCPRVTPFFNWKSLFFLEKRDSGFHTNKATVTPFFCFERSKVHPEDTRGGFVRSWRSTIQGFPCPAASRERASSPVRLSTPSMIKPP